MPPDFRQYSDEQVDAVVRRVLDEVGLPQSYCITIRSLVRSRAQNWRSCCGGNCNPCIGKIEEAVDRSRQILRAAGPALANDAAAKGEPANGSSASSAPADPVTVTKPDPRSPSGSDTVDDDDSEDRNWGLDYI